MPRLRRIGVAIKCEDFARRMTPSPDIILDEDLDRAPRESDSVVSGIEDDRLIGREGRDLQQDVVR
jgi:hypothetical protein